MAATVADVMGECRNYFVGSSLEGSFIIRGSAIETIAGTRLDMLALAGQYVAISGSILNDGVYLVKEDHTLEGLREEAFRGRLCFLRPPRAFVDLCEEIAVFDTKAPASAVVSESFGNYSHSKATGQSGAVLGWKEAFASQMKPYRRMFGDL